MKFLVLLFFIFIANSAKRRDQSLQLVHVFFRHGNRTPDVGHMYPTDPHRNTTFSSGYGAITPKGEKRLRKLGRFLHKRYGHFLGNFSNETVEARTSYYDRTKLSLQFVMSELFPYDEAPFPFTFKEMMEDREMVRPIIQCPRYKKHYKEYVDSAQFKEILHKYNETIDYVYQHSGISRADDKPLIQHLYELYVTLEMELENGLSIPEWTNSVFPQPLKNLTDLFFKSTGATDLLKKLGPGFILKKMLRDSSDQLIENSINRKIYLYSGHEFNIVLLMEILGIYYPHEPPYTAFLTLEIYKKNGVDLVRIYYQDYSSRKIKRMRIPNCYPYCRFKRFVKLYKKLLPKTADDCNLQN